VPRFPAALRRTGIRFLGILVPPGNWAFVTSGLPGSAWRRPRTLTGFPRSACASSDRGGRPLDPEASGVHTADEICPAAACRSSTARPCTPVFVPSAGALGNEASAGVHSRSPVRSSPRLRSRMERERFGFFPELRTPQLPATHVRAGTGLEHWPGATSPTSSSALQSTNSLAACDLVSHDLSPVLHCEHPLSSRLTPPSQEIPRGG
jgi:hypothetical protein